MSVWLVLPLRSLREGKTRLASVLDAAQRSALIDRLLVHTLDQAAQFPGLQRTLLVSACDEARVRAQAYGACVLEEPMPGLNHALQRARLSVCEMGAARMLMVPCDLPLLCAEDLRHLASASCAGDIAIAPDGSRHGTNGICLPAATAFAFAFGPSSFERHLAHIEQLGLRARVVERPGLAFDVDTPDDLAQLRAVEQRRPVDAVGAR